ncbi:mycothione reductase [Nocardioides sp. InS609-2]|uniref:mycothione reductase n=1 Tax=Nocardioides sp. InS609-2 TaxID=2760705 RepID=UPI0020C0B7B5|nr:mycothione reductase [Nocardioides sp. InS609-2]
MGDPKRYDLIVIGAGSGNTVVDDRFSSWRVAIIERAAYGGTCLNRGCIPSKMFVVPADRAREAADGARLDVRTSYDGVGWAALRDRVFGRTDASSRAGRDAREGLDHVDTFKGTATFTGPHTLRVALEGGDEEELTADRIVLATGSRPVVPDLPGLADVEHHTSDTVMHLEALPRTIGILGGGYVGCEFAHVFASLGSTVVQIEAEDTLLGNQDADVARLFTEHASLQWDVRTGTTVERFSQDGDAIMMHLDRGDPVTVDTLLVCVGRRPNSDGLGLEAAGIEVDDNDRVVVDEHQHTSAESVWALGDISSHHPLKHVANHEARVVQHNLLHPADPVEADHRYVPNAVFTSPQIGGVGLTEAEAREQGIDVAVATSTYAGIAYGWALEADDEGWFCKLVADRSTGLLVGAHLIGPLAATLVQPLITAMCLEQPVAGLARSQYWIHPAPTEVVEQALLALEKELSAGR